VLRLRRGYSSEQQGTVYGGNLTTRYSLLNTKESRSSVWLEHYTDNVGVSSSNLLGTTAGLYVVGDK
jgi:hypothetical protein